MAFNTRLFVGNLSDTTNEHALRDAFSSYGEITNVDIKCKSAEENGNKKKFAFITISATNFNVESCIKFFSNENFQGNRLYVTRARESFLERLQRERDQSQNKNVEQHQEIHLPVKPKTFTEHQNTHKRKFDDNEELNANECIKKFKVKPVQIDKTFLNKPSTKLEETINKTTRFGNDVKKQDSDKKRQESMKKKRQEFNAKKNIIKTGLVSIDTQSNKKIIFSDCEDNTVQQKVKVNGHIKENNKSTLFDDRESDEDINFEIKKQYEGKKGQKVLDLQSRFKSDKRFTMDERFVEDSESDEEHQNEHENVDLNQADEKSKQLNILQNVLGVTIKAKTIDTGNKNKTKLGMLRFDPTQPEHAKYLVPVNAEVNTKKTKKKKSKDSKDEEKERVVEKVEVSKEQFYKISDNLKDTMSQPTTFTLRSLFTKVEDDQQEEVTADINCVPLQTKKTTKVKNPLEPDEKNPFVYDSSESENEEETTNGIIIPSESTEPKTVWREKLFFSATDHRLKDGLIFFGKTYENEPQKERRGLKSLMKKRIYNNERKNTMFQKKIGGRKKTMKKKWMN